MTETATRKAEEDCNNLDFFHRPDTSFAIILYLDWLRKWFAPGRIE